MRVVVIGGGIAGSACAIGLRRIGAEVTVYEAHPDPSGPVGSFLSLAVNGLRGLDALGCLDPVRRAGFAVERQRMWSGGGRLLADVPRGRAEGDPMRSVTLMRGDLVAALRAEALRSGARIETGTRLDQDPPDADLVVGADGIRSAMRRRLDPGSPEPAYAGIHSISGVSAGAGQEGGVFNMVLGGSGAFIHLAAPDGSVWWSAQVAAAEAPDPRGLGLDDAIACFAAEPGPSAVLGAARTVHGATLHHVLAPIARRHDGRAVLIGDAAHPVGAGQGASMAIEDAVILARELHRRASVAEALDSFDGLRQRRLAKVVRNAAQNRQAKTAGPVQAALRNLMMPVFFPLVYPRATAWLYRFDVGRLPAPDGSASDSTTVQLST
ncbi:MAG TPA: FAD-dependent oxidoreductase [Candidatus Dormibacteraeota bacterium]|nr:FAD-dependent oxidoreductase [Candidatus Dormibacteraeota bacterium]